LRATQTTAIQMASRAARPVRAKAATAEPTDAGLATLLVCMGLSFR